MSRKNNVVKKTSKKTYSLVNAGYAQDSEFNRFTVHYNIMRDQSYVNLLNYAAFQLPKNYTEALCDASNSISTKMHIVFESNRRSEFDLLLVNVEKKRVEAKRIADARVKKLSEKIEKAVVDEVTLRQAIKDDQILSYKKLEGVHTRGHRLFSAEKRDAVQECLKEQELNTKRKTILRLSKFHAKIFAQNYADRKESLLAYIKLFTDKFNEGISNDHKCIVLNLLVNLKTLVYYCEMLERSPAIAAILVHLSALRFINVLVIFFQKRDLVVLQYHPIMVELTTLIESAGFTSDPRSFLPEACAVSIGLANIHNGLLTHHYSLLLQDVNAFLPVSNDNKLFNDLESLIISVFDKFFSACVEEEGTDHPVFSNQYSSELESTIKIVLNFFNVLQAKLLSLMSNTKTAQFITPVHTSLKTLLPGLEQSCGQFLKRSRSKGSQGAVVQSMAASAPKM
ncbi:MAG: hypothetical protein NTZ67_02230 [Gammaproteobacteria bacterium]|nr:hypothetical protein [Gammaproteobacteria bacterium]